MTQIPVIPNRVVVFCSEQRMRDLGYESLRLKGPAADHGITLPEFVYCTDPAKIDRALAGDKEALTDTLGQPLEDGRPALAIFIGPVRQPAAHSGQGGTIQLPEDFYERLRALRIPLDIITLPPTP